MAVKTKLFPQDEILSLISGKMLAKNRPNVGMLYDIVQFMRNDDHFSEDARCVAPISTAEHFLRVHPQCVVELKKQLPELTAYPIPDRFSQNDANLNFEDWYDIFMADTQPVMVTSFDKY